MAKVLTVNGTVEYQGTDRVWKELVPGAEIPDGAMLRSANDSGATLGLLDGGSDLLLGPDTIVTFGGVTMPPGGGRARLRLSVATGTIDGHARNLDLVLGRPNGADLLVTPNGGDTVPFGFGQRWDDYLHHALFGIVPENFDWALIHTSGDFPITILSPVRELPFVPQPQVPEPGETHLLVLGLAGLGWWGSRRGTA